MPSSRKSSWLRDQTRVSCVSCVAGGFFFLPLSHQGSHIYKPIGIKNRMRCIHLGYKFLLQYNVCRDQMNSGRGWELGPRAQSCKWSVMVSFSEMPTEHPGELAPGGYAVGQNDVTLWKVSPLVDQFIRGIETQRMKKENGWNQPDFVCSWWGRKKK